MIINRKEIEKRRVAPGIIMQALKQGAYMNALHWDMDDGSIVELHHHPQEQFGYVIKGGFIIQLGDEEFEIGAGDAYYIPPNVPHRFVAVGQTEAIDVFNPLRLDYPKGEEVT